MTSSELRQKFIKYFESKGHKQLPSSSLIPQDDPSVLLTTAGMQQFKKWYTRVEEPHFSRVVTIQKCVRIDDIEEVGDATHLSFFEMLGNFSFGSTGSPRVDGYFKKEAIEYALEFITKELGIKFDDLYFTYFKGDKETPKDEDALKILQELRIPENKIIGFGKEDNFWGPTGAEGPCGPTVEIFVGDPKEDGVEIWNLVFNQYYRLPGGEYKKLEHQGVDTGAGLERVLSILNNVPGPYETELFANTISKIREMSKNKDEKAEKIIADHLRAATFLLADGVRPSNLDKGYVLRRLIRRAIRFGKVLNIEGNFAALIAEVVINDYKIAYPELKESKKEIIDELNKEEEKFSKTLEVGLRQFEKEYGLIGSFVIGVDRIGMTRTEKKELITGADAFDLFSTYGFPYELTVEIAEDKGIKLDRNVRSDFEKEFKKHQEISSKGAEKKFKGGLETGGEIETKFHTATHLLQQALRTILGDHVKQSGSNITSERLRFDFTHPKKMTPEEISAVENLVNEQIKAALPVTVEEMILDEAQKSGAIGLFESRYGEKVKVYTIGPSTRDARSGSREFFSREICGGPHVKNTSELGHFHIKKEESSSAGIRRIKAVLE